MPLVSFSGPFHSECKLMVYLLTMYVYCVYPAISKRPKQLPNHLKMAETRVVVIIFIGVLLSHGYTSLHEFGTKKAMAWSVTVITNIYLVNAISLFK